MKSILRILVLGVVPILAATAVVDQGLAADKGSQLIFQSNMAHQNYTSVSNTSSNAVTVLVQYYNDEMKPVLFYLRVITGGGTVLVDPFNHEIPGTAEEDDDGNAIMGTATNVSDELASLPAMTNDDDGPGINSGHFVIAVTAVGANIALDENADKDNKDVTAAAENSTDASEENNARTVNVLFPAFLAADMHGTNNIDNEGTLKDVSVTPYNADGAGSELVYGNNLALVKPGDDGAPSNVAESEKDLTSKNVGGLTVGNAVPVAFNHLTGNFTEALVGTDAGGADQTASWGGTPVVRPGVLNNDNMMMGAAATETTDDVVDYLTLTGVDSAVNDTNQAIVGGGRLAEKDGGGKEHLNRHTVAGYTAEGGNTIDNGVAFNRALTEGALVLPSLYGGGDETKQIMLLLSAADQYGGSGGGYKLMAAMTKYNIVLMDSMGDALPDPADDRVFGGSTGPEVPTLGIIVNGIMVMQDAGDCAGDSMLNMAPRWSLADLTDLIPTASSGSKTFAGLDAMMYPMMNASPGSIKFKRGALKCKKNYGDGTPATGGDDVTDDGDGVPAKDERTYTGGTLIVEEKNTERTFITTGQALLKFITPGSTFAASWSLKSPASMNDADRTNVPDDGILSRETETN